MSRVAGDRVARFLVSGFGLSQVREGGLCQESLGPTPQGRGDSEGVHGWRIMIATSQSNGILILNSGFLIIYIKYTAGRGQNTRLPSWVRDTNVRMQRRRRDRRDLSTRQIAPTRSNKSHVTAPTPLSHRSQAPPTIAPSRTPNHTLPCSGSP